MNTKELRDQLDQIARLDKACGSGEGEWRGAIVGNCNLVAYDGEDAVGIALVPYGPRIEFIAALVNWYRSGGRELAERYLWLRDYADESISEDRYDGTMWSINGIHDPEDKGFDAAIDAVRKEHGD